MLHHISNRAILFLIAPFSALGSNILLDNITPPPLIISDFNIYGYESDLREGARIDEAKQKVDLSDKLDVLGWVSSISVSAGKSVDIYYDDRMDRNASIVMNGHGATVVFWRNDSPLIYRKFNSIHVNYGDGYLSFINGANNQIFIDDLIIDDFASLTLQGLYPKYGDGIFVKKTSVHLQDALGKIRFERQTGKVGVRDYNWEYWEIGIGAGFHPTPEPATCGAAVSLCGLGLVVWRRRRRRRGCECRSGFSLVKRR